MSLVVGTYPIDPVDPAESRRFYEELDRSGLYGALELPVDATGARAVPAAVPDDWSLVLTAIPGTMQLMGADPDFGLASTDERGRRRALDFAAALRVDVMRLAGTGRRTLAVQLHSAPRGTGSKIALRDSLHELLTWDWAGAAITIEHCDALVEDHAPEKGFLSLDDEIDTVRQLAPATSTPVGITINWARSVIETRDPEAAVRHVARAAEADVLVGLMFSSCAPTATDFGYAWIDAHLPAREVPDAPAESLLTTTDIRECLSVAGPMAYTGLKIDLRPRGLPAAELAARVNAMGVTISHHVRSGAAVPATLGR